MKQYWDVKSAHPDKIILFRLGDFYEMFHDDAVTAAPILGIALTRRNAKSQDETPLCGVPHHSIEGPINKLLKAGFKIAVCEQLEDPAQAKGIVKRGVTRVLTPGMVYDPSQIPQDKGNYICALTKDMAAFADASTGEAFCYAVGPAEGLALIQILRPVEYLITKEFSEIENDMIEEIRRVGVVTVVDDFGGDACEILRMYIRSSQGGMEPKEFVKRHKAGKICLSSLAIRHLEIFETYQGEREGSLLHAVDRTKTSVGARQLRRWLSFPETLGSIIEERLDRVEHWTRMPEALKEKRAKLAAVGDMERRMGRLFLSNSDGRDLLALAQSIQLSLEVIDSSNIISLNEVEIEKLAKLAKLTERTLREELPVGVREGGLIRKGVHPELDEWVNLTSGHSELLQSIEQRERAATGISSLKVKYNAVFGYFLEVTHTHKDKVPKHYIRKQTLASAERYTIDELIHLEDKILAARSKRFELEFEIFQSLREDFKNLAQEILKLSRWVGEFDVILALAWLALEKSYVRPVIEPGRVVLLSSRHPVVEQALGSFVANDIFLNRQEAVLLTGPNMAGKSTLMRQIALSALLMQVGSFVPAREARLPIFSRILTRIGSSDNLAEGLSTFMVEMKESAELIEAADSDSLIILDEIGRGTSTFDGMSLAQAILEHLHSNKKATILFATHYHELANLEADIKGIQNYHMSIREKNGEVNFLYQLTKGAAGKSYGVQVGVLAGLPGTVTKRAAQILAGYEETAKKRSNQLDLFALMQTAQINEEDQESQFEEEIKGLDINSLTPIAALNKIVEWKKHVT